MRSIGAEAPSARAGCTLTVDDKRKRALLVGGYNGMTISPTRPVDPTALYDDVWEVTVSRKEEGLGLGSGSDAVSPLCNRCQSKGTIDDVLIHDSLL
jgi:hypothetical protein